MTLDTSETATCKYDTDGGEDYAVMANTFTTTNSTSHSQTLTGLTNGSSYTYYIRCTDGTNANTDDFIISFSVEDSPPSESNLFSDNTYDSDSANFQKESRDANELWDEITGNTPENTAVAWGYTSFWVIFDLGNVYSLDTTRIFGDYVGDAHSNSWTFEYRLNEVDSWTAAFTESACLGNQWYSQDVSAITQARYIRVTVNGPSAGTNAREIELTGTLYGQEGGGVAPSRGDFMINIYHR
jgi:hypothetical protein